MTHHTHETKIITYLQITVITILFQNVLQLWFLAFL